MVSGAFVVDPSVLDRPGLGMLVHRLGLPIAETPLLRLNEMAWICLLLAVVWFLPNATQWMRHYQTALGARPKSSWVERRAPASTWRPAPAFGFAIGVFGMFTLLQALSAAPTEFLYFQF